MKKIGILNQDISEVIAGLGHFDTLVVCDAGLPIPLGVRRIDLALRPGLPGFLETLKAVAVELQVESWIMAQEVREESPHILEGVREVFPSAEGEFVPHSEFKELCRNAKAIIRTGEFTHYSNVILVAGVVF
jgi:D-ribose pyranase